MINSLIRSCARYVPSAIHHLGRHTKVSQRDYTPLFTRALTSSSFHKPFQGDRGLFCLGATVLAGTSIIYGTGENEKAHLEEGPKPLYSIYSVYSGTYQAYCYNPIPPHIVKEMIAGGTYKEGCPIPLSDLAYVKVTHYDMEGRSVVGEFVLHKEIAERVMRVFAKIHAAQFPIKQMHRIEKYGADDDRSMLAGNTSAFCYRDITGKVGTVSKHGLGLAIDVNPHLNPYVKGEVVAPLTAKKYLDRSLEEPGMIHPGDPVVTAFKEEGFTWGGDWATLKDYQHFEIDPSSVGIVI